MDNNTHQVITGIFEAGQSPHSAAAVKFTALTGTPLLRRISALQGKANSHLHSLGAVPSPLEGLFVGSLFPYLAPKGSKIAALQSHPSVQRLVSELSPEDLAKAQEFIQRVERIISTGASSKPAVDALTFDLQRAFNRDRAVVQNTFQCYLRETVQKVPIYLKASRREGVKLGAKLVRGAYMIEEGRLAEEQRVESPIHKTKEGTDACYNSSVSLLISSLCPGDELTIASHNPDSVSLGQRLLSQRGLSKKCGGVSFAQLMGMKHKLSVQLAQEGYITQKYLPWGPIGRLIPYLARRAHESFGIRDQIEEQVRQIIEEMKARLVNK